MPPPASRAASVRSGSCGHEQGGNESAGRSGHDDCSSPHGQSLPFAARIRRQQGKAGASGRRQVGCRTSRAARRTSTPRARAAGYRRPPAPRGQGLPHTPSAAPRGLLSSGAGQAAQPARRTPGHARPGPREWSGSGPGSPAAPGSRRRPPSGNGSYTGLKIIVSKIGAARPAMRC